MPEFAARCAPHVGWIPADDEGAAYIHKHAGKMVQIKISQPRSMEQNNFLWGVAGVCFASLPERLSGKWADKETMIDGLKLRLGIVDEVATWDKDGWKIVARPKSLAKMEAQEANETVDKLVDGMAALLGVPVDELLNEAHRRAA